LPIYEYVCLDCDERFALLQSFYPPENDTSCPKCSSTDVKKIISSFSCSSGDKAGQTSSSPGSSGGGG